MKGKRFWITFNQSQSDLLKTVTVERWPDWAASGDCVEIRRGRHFLVSHLETEPRWRKWLNRIRGIIFH